MLRRLSYPKCSIAFLSIIGFASILLITRWGIGLSPDSTVYIEAARNLTDGQGFSLISRTGKPRPITGYPPLYPAVLALIGATGMEPLDGARTLNALLFGANILLVGLLLHNYLSRHRWLAVFGAFLVLTSMDILEIHAMAWSEPLFIFLVLLTLLSLAKYVKKPSNKRFMICSSIAVLATLTRYAGIVLPLTGIVILSFKEKKRDRNLIEATIFSAFCILPLVFWFTRNILLTGNAASRRLAFHPLGILHVKDFIFTVSTWFMPAFDRYAVKGSLASILFLLALILVFYVRRQYRLENKNNLVISFVTNLSGIVSVFIVIYLIFMVVSISLVDAYTPLDKRILSPIHVCGLVLICLLAQCIFDLNPRRAYLQAICVLLLLTAGITYAYSSISVAASIYNEGRGYASKLWKNSDTILGIRRLRGDMLIFSNGPDAIYILTKRRSLMIPAKMSPNSRTEISGYKYNLSKMKEQLREQDGILVYFKSIDWRRHLPSESELLEHLPLGEVEKYPDGHVYKIDEAQLRN